ncbi:MAG TPA: hypothetical protein QF784_06295, partial [Prochlorococcaceae cyanobacterium Fu_MAG_134]|nr:hypothetical protein [Prochlorococcaceae cyanobacterium Fu_MAG_134]
MHGGDNTLRASKTFKLIALASSFRADTVKTNYWSGSMASIQETSSESTTLPTDLKAEQALGFIGMGLMQKMMHEG